MNVNEAFTLVAQAAKQAKALAMLEGVLGDANNLAANVKEQQALLETAKKAVADATAEVSRIKSQGEAALRSASEQVKKSLDIATADAARTVAAAKEAARKMLDDAGRAVMSADTELADLDKRKTAIAAVVATLVSQRDNLTNEVSKLKERFRSLVA